MADLPAIPEPLDGLRLEEDFNDSALVDEFAGEDTFSRTDIASGFLKLPWLRQVSLLLGFAGVITFGFMLIIWSQDPEYRPLYNNIEPTETPAIVNILEEAGIGFTVERESGMVLVATSDIHKARMKVAAADILTARKEGYVILDQEQQLGTSRFMETARYQRAIEGELAKTVASLKNVHKARVMLAIPKQSVFVRDKRKPSASVFVEVITGRELEKHMVKSIMHLISYSVPEMEKNDVTVIDQHGNLLSEFDDEGDLGETEKQFKFTKKVETELLDKIHKILQPVVGETRFNAQVSADVDFTWVEETQEMFNPDLSAIRAEETLEEIRGGADLGGVPGALANQPQPAATAPEDAINADGEDLRNIVRQRKQATRNYELDRTISHTRYPVGRVTRLTVAVVLDDMHIPDAVTGELKSIPWDQASLLRLSQLIQDSIGYSASRGDRVTIINEPFVPTVKVEIPEPGFWTEAWFISLAKQLMVGVLVVFLTFFVLRPVLNMLAGPSAEDRMKELVSEQELERLAEYELEQEEELMQESVTLSGGEELLLPGPGDLFGRQLDAIKALVDENPSRVAEVVKSWVAQEA